MGQGGARGFQRESGRQPLVLGVCGENLIVGGGRVRGEDGSEQGVVTSRN